jgi:hypothetical protein
MNTDNTVLVGRRTLAMYTLIASASVGGLTMGALRVWFAAPEGLARTLGAFVGLMFLWPCIHSHGARLARHLVFVACTSLAFFAISALGASLGSEGESIVVNTCLVLAIAAAIYYWQQRARAATS